MADEGQVTLLKSGVEAWNEWRRGDPGEGIGRRHVLLDAADLRRLDLHGANLGGAMLVRADLAGANLLMADLSGAYLSGANLTKAELTGANLTGAHLDGANLTAARLAVTDLSGAELTWTNLTMAQIGGANFEQCSLSACNFAMTSLRGARGLETCRHRGPSSIDYETLMRSGRLPEIFLRGCGLPDNYIKFLPSFWNDPIEFYSCFISYSHADKSLAQRLHDALQGRGIRCWRDEHELLPGDDIRDEIDRGIRLWDKVLLCCSEASLKDSWWVDKEMGEGRGEGQSGSGVRASASPMENVMGWFDLDALPIMQDARRQRLSAARTAFEMGIPLNELNRLLDLGIKPFPWGDTPYVPSTLQPVSASTPAPKGVRISPE